MRPTRMVELMLPLSILKTRICAWRLIKSDVEFDVQCSGRGTNQRSPRIRRRESTTSPRSVDDTVLEILRMVLREMPVQAFFCEIRQEYTAWATEAAVLAMAVLVLLFVAVFVGILIHNIRCLIAETAHGGVLLCIALTGKRAIMWRA